MCVCLRGQARFAFLKWEIPMTMLNKNIKCTISAHEKRHTMLHIDGLLKLLKPVEKNSL